RTEVLIATPAVDDDFTHGHVRIRLVPRRRLNSQGDYFSRFSQVFYFGTIGVVALKIALLARNTKRCFIATDGGVFSTGRRVVWRRLLARLFYRFYDRFYTYTEFQKNVLCAVSKRYNGRIFPILPILESRLRPPVSRNPHPTLLYMGHFSRFKGVDTVMTLYETLASEFPELRLTLASNGLVYDDNLQSDIEAFVKRRHPRVVLKGKVNPFEELAVSHILVYPLRQQAGTFAFPLSLYESLTVGTPFLSSNIAGVNEFFDDYFLADPEDVGSFVSKAARILKYPDEAQAAVAANLDKLKVLLRIDEDSRYRIPN
ncbi:MAG: glycosyltransferase family 4 protein, partial [Candidatus Zixiibacteriota bacterium]